MVVIFGDLIVVCGIEIFQMINLEIFLGNIKTTWVVIVCRYFHDSVDDGNFSFLPKASNFSTEI